MSSRAPLDAQQRLHRYVAVLFAVTLPLLAITEMFRMDAASSLAPIRWASYMVLAIWALWLTQRPRVNTLMLILSAIAFFGSLSIIEALFGTDVSAFDFTTSFGLMMMLGVLAGTLSAGSRLVWSGAVGLSIALWSITVGVLEGHPAEVLAVRSVVAIAGVIFTTALVSRLYDELSSSITRYEKATRLQNAIATCSEALLVQTDRFAIYEALRALLKATEADYAYVDVNETIEGTVHWEIIAEATRKTTVAPTEWKKGEYGPGSPTFNTLSGGRSIVVRTKALKGDDRKLYEEAGIVSEVVVPIFVEDSFRGSIGFVQKTEDRVWSEDEIGTLWRASHMIGAYWRRQDDQDRLKETSESKDRLLASVSHEIRTPLTAIVGLSEEIVSSRTSLGGEELDELNGIIALQSRELAELVEDLLVASRAESGSLSIKPEYIDLREEVHSVLRGVQESHPSNKAIVISGGEVVAWADALRCRQVFRNLLTNAIKYGGDRVAVLVRKVGNEAQVLVVDDGHGVTADEEELIFERYYRSQDSPTQPGSVGIGLAVSRQLAEMMGGDLRYIGTSDEPRFEFSLPTGPRSSTSSGSLSHELATGSKSTTSR
ncbi:MAG: sensor histidine kinase [Acidimicrobiia bacterium]